MSDFTEGVLEGLFCETCGTVIDMTEPGYPRRCTDCTAPAWREERDALYARLHDATRNPAQPNSIARHDAIVKLLRALSRCTAQEWPAMKIKATHAIAIWKTKRT